MRRAWFDAVRGGRETPEASLTREGHCGFVDSRGLLAKRVYARTTVAGQRRNFGRLPRANLYAHYARCLLSQPLRATPFRPSKRVEIGRFIIFDSSSEPRYELKFIL
jgi:hypothetical protein